jgi:hypothetical protein
MSSPRLVLNAFPHYSAAWNPKTDTWAIKHMPDLTKAAGRVVIDVPKVDNRDGVIEATFHAVDPSLSEADAAKLAAHAILDFFWPDPEEEGDVKSVALVDTASGTRYEFEGPE